MVKKQLVQTVKATLPLLHLLHQVVPLLHQVLPQSLERIVPLDSDLPPTDWKACSNVFG